MAKRIFLSYSRKDLTFVKKLAKDLEKAGYIVWYDLTEIEGGDRWAQEIQDGINQSEVFTIVVSPRSVVSAWVEKEYLFASRRGMKVVPLLHEASDLPIWLLDIQYIDLVGANYARNFHQVLEAFDNYGRRADDAKPEPVSLRNRLPHIPLPFLLLFISVLAVLAFLVVPTSPISITAPTVTLTHTVTQSPIKTNTPTLTATYTSTATLPPTRTPASVDATESATLTPSPTLTHTPTPSGTPTEEGLAPVMTDESGAEMQLVKAGPFLMGSDTGEADEGPAHMVSVGDFYIDKYEVTNADYKACVDGLACGLPKNTTFYVSPLYKNHAAVFVSWEMAADYCTWRNARLPTEAEWEKAARGTNSNNYPWGNAFNGYALNYCDLTCENSWADKSVRDKYAMLAPVGAYPDGQSDYGVYDMAGNAAEWVADWYGKEYYEVARLIDPHGPETGIYRVLRGGSWYDRKTDVRTFKRSQLRPEVAYNYTGFRCAVSAEE